MAGLTELRSIVGEPNAREAGDADRVDGVQARFVAAPANTEEVSRLMVLASGEGWRVAPRGNGSKLGIGNPPEAVDLIVDMTRFDRILEHAAGDLVVAVEPGVRLDTLQEQLRGAGQMLAIESPDPDATIGGIIAANPSGSRRFRYGTVRDLLIGVTVVLADGTVAKAGGKVVKNVAGYDLSKLMTGSLGTLGIIVKAIFRLHPLPQAQRLVIAEPSGPPAIASVVQQVLQSPLVPSAIQLAWSADGVPWIGVLFEGVEPSVVSQAETAVGLFAGLSPAVLAGTEVEGRWAELVGNGADAGEVEVKVTCLPASVGSIIETIRTAADRHGCRAHLRGHIGNGVLYVRLEGDEDRGVAAVLDEIRGAVRPGSAVVLRAPAEVKQVVDVWGPVGDTETLMRRIKDRFDPDHILNPGRFVGGI